jgi:hypothetical protein
VAIEVLAEALGPQKSMVFGLIVIDCRRYGNRPFIRNWQPHNPYLLKSLNYCQQVAIQRSFFGTKGLVPDAE